MNKKTKAITIAVLGIIMIFAVVTLSYPKGNYSTSINRIVEIKNGVANAETFGSTLTVKSKGKYRLVADWWMGEKQTYDSPSFITGLVLTDEAGQFRYPLTAGSIHSESGITELEPGRYNVTFRVLPTQKSYNDFCAANYEKFDPAGSPDESFFHDGTWDMHYSFRIAADTSKYVAVCLLTGIVVGILLVVIIATLATRSDAPAKKYDERQIAMQGRAYKYAFFTMFIYFTIVAVFSMISSLPVVLKVSFSTDFLVTQGVLTGAVVFAVTAIIHDAYFRLDDNQTMIIAIFTVSSLINIAIGVFRIIHGDAAKTGIINMMNSGNLLCGISLLVLPIAIMVKKLLDRNEE